MRAPNAVQKLIRNFHQDVFAISANSDEAVDAAVRMLSSKDSAEAKAFLDGLLDGNLGVEEIRLVWDSVPKDIRIDDDKGVKAFLEHLRDRLVAK